ncbi:MAG TPA: hypothetical protein DIU00_04710, partial [Phycisphaerales bacterium]|nr:hypothetical protein [Phycisphaerales bacterium]
DFTPPFTTYRNEKTRIINFKDFNYSCEFPVLLAAIEDNIDHIEKAFLEYNTKLNRDLIEKVFNQVPFLTNTPNEVRDLIANYPESVIYNKDNQ